MQSFVVGVIAAGSLVLILCIFYACANAILNYRHRYDFGPDIETENPYIQNNISNSRENNYRASNLENV